jgi:succinyl-CoA synthetase alpha subunit
MRSRFSRMIQKPRVLYLLVKLEDGLKLKPRIGSRIIENVFQNPSKSCDSKLHQALTPYTRPISAIIAGVNAVPRRVMGHAGAFTSFGEPDALIKIKALEKAGVTMVNHPENFGDAMKTLLGKSGRASSGSSVAGSQKRGIHTMKIRPTREPQHDGTRILSQKRRLHIREHLAFDLLRERGINTSEYSGTGRRRMLAVGVDRSNRSPCIIASPASDPANSYSEVRRYLFDYRKKFDPIRAAAVAEHLQLADSVRDSLPKLINGLIDLFKTKEALHLETQFVERLGELKVVGASFTFDDDAFRSTKRQADIHALRHPEDEDPQEVKAEADGIVYIKFPGDGNIGTLVNGAGLAMNTVDALADAGGKAANFLDTGGKATSETVKKSFQVILKDDRVKVIFVNIFGGLTLGDMIANGILMTFKELEMSLPVVVRIRGTNEEEGQRIVSVSFLSQFNLYSVVRSLSMR